VEWPGGSLLHEEARAAGRDTQARVESRVLSPGRVKQNGQASGLAALPFQSWLLPVVVTTWLL